MSSQQIDRQTDRQQSNDKCSVDGFTIESVLPPLTFTYNAACWS